MRLTVRSVLAELYHVASHALFYSYRARGNIALAQYAGTTELKPDSKRS